MRYTPMRCTSVRYVARSRQVCIYWLWKHCLLLSILLGNEQILIHIRKPCRSSACLVRIAGPCPAVPVQLAPAQLGLSPAGPYQLWCTSLRIVTEMRPTRNNHYLQWSHWSRPDRDDG